MDSPLCCQAVKNGRVKVLLCMCSGVARSFWVVASLPVAKSPVLPIYHHTKTVIKIYNSTSYKINHDFNVVKCSNHAFSWQYDYHLFKLGLSND